MLSQSQAGSTQWNNVKDRLPTVSLSQALQNAPILVPTGLPTLDSRLHGGLLPGLLTEVYGPPGSGKTAFAIHMTSRILETHAEETAGDGIIVPQLTDETLVVWFEASQSLPSSRLRDMIATDDFDVDVEKAKLSRVTTVQVPSLASLMALLLFDKPGSLPSFLKQETRMLVIDDLTTLFNAAFPPEDNRSGQQGESQAQRRARVTKLLAQTLQTLAASYGLIILVLCKLTTRVVAGTGATLVASLGDAWQDACSTRLLLYRDFPPVRLSADDAAALRYFAVQKVGGAMLARPEGVPVRIVGAGFREMDLEELSRSVSSKRRVIKTMPAPALQKLAQEDALAYEGTSEELPTSAGTDLLSAKRSASPDETSEFALVKRVMLEEVHDSEDDEGLDDVALEEEAERA